MSTGDRARKLLEDLAGDAGDDGYRKVWVLLDQARDLVGRIDGGGILIRDEKRTAKLHDEAEAHVLAAESLLAEMKHGSAAFRASAGDVDPPTAAG